MPEIWGTDGVLCSTDSVNEETPGIYMMSENDAETLSSADCWEPWNHNEMAQR